MKLPGLPLSLLLLLIAFIPVTGCGRSGQPVKVALTWDQSVDFDLEIWNADGSSPLVQGFDFCGEDIADGRAGEEFFLFIRHDENNDFSTGTFRVQALLTPLSPEDKPVRAVLTVTRPDGTTREIVRTFPPDESVSQWVVLTVNAVSGDVEIVDRVK